jgi:anti-anti-sigma regulatory factor
MKTEDSPARGQGTAPAASDDKGTASPTTGTVPRKIALGASCTIEDVALLRTELIDHLTANTPVIIDASRLERIDTAGVQLLAAFAIDCLERGTAFAWKQRPAVLEEAIRLLGLGALMESPGAVFDAGGES